MNLTRMIAVMLLSVACLPACDRKSEKDQTAPIEEKEQASAVEKDEAGEEPEQKADELQVDAAGEGDLAAAASSTNQVGFDLMNRLPEGNATLSPVSISTAMAMAYAGAGGETSAQLAKVMHFGEGAVSDFGELSAVLDERNKKVGEDGEVVLKLANDIWIQENYELGDAYLATIKDTYGSVPRFTNFAEAPDEARKEINADVSKKTREKIPELIGNGIIDGYTRTVLTNAMYLNAAWAAPFKAESTNEASFAAPEGEVTVDMMQQDAYLRRASGEGFEVVEKPYLGDELAALIVLPEQGKFEAVQKAFDAEAFSKTVTGLERKYVRLQMPKFSVRLGTLLTEDLREMGAPLAFSDAADFDAMHPELKISDVVHETFIDVDEKGTEAAAATAVVMSTRSLPPKPEAFVVDRPFFFYVYDKPTGAILFAARVMNPAESSDSDGQE